MNVIFNTYFQARRFNRKTCFYIKYNVSHTLFTAIKTQIAEKTVEFERIISEQKKEILDITEKNAELERNILDLKKTVSDYELALMCKHTEEQKVSQFFRAQSTQTEALPLIPLSQHRVRTVYLGRMGVTTDDIRHIPVLKMECP